MASSWEQLLASRAWRCSTGDLWEQSTTLLPLTGLYLHISGLCSPHRDFCLSSNQILLRLWVEMRPYL